MKRAADPFDPLDGAITDTLDLHGLSAPEAKTAVTGFVRRAPKGALLHVITGKGKNSAGAPVLRNTIRTMLKAGSIERVKAWGRDDDEGGFLLRLHL
jgi:DNA-nicking Smr family endonuclease